MAVTSDIETVSAILPFTETERGGGYGEGGGGGFPSRLVVGFFFLFV